jgi:hypothetical protein
VSHLLVTDRQPLLRGAQEACWRFAGGRRAPVFVGFAFVPRAGCVGDSAAAFVRPAARDGDFAAAFVRPAAFFGDFAAAFARPAAFAAAGRDGLVDPGSSTGGAGDAPSSRKRASPSRAMNAPAPA